jgi:hypothetical protein
MKANPGDAHGDDQFNTVIEAVPEPMLHLDAAA